MSTRTQGELMLFLSWFRTNYPSPYTVSDEYLVSQYRRELPSQEEGDTSYYEAREDTVCDGYEDDFVDSSGWESLVHEE